MGRLNRSAPSGASSSIKKAAKRAACAKLIIRLAAIAAPIGLGLFFLVRPPWASDKAKAALLWPLTIREGCTSSFGEYRRTHFHGGVDMRTHQEVGWPCLAVADGKVVRIRREPGGYGRVLYLQLNDGRMAVYGHLCRFENRHLHLDDILAAACQKAGTSFPGDVAVDPPAPVKAGDVVAYSGDLGVGFPHLHFEVRRGDDLLDPFVEGLPLPDGMTPPRIAAVVFSPQDATGLVDGGFAPVEVAAIRENGAYRLARKVSLDGAVDLFVVAADQLGVSSNSTGIPLINASLDATPFFTMDLRRISLARFKQSRALFDPDYDRRGAQAYRLRRLPWLKVEGIEGDGLPKDLAPGPHELRVRAGNRAGMESVVTGVIEEARREPDRRLALPGTGYRILSNRLTAAGLVLELTRSSESGVTPVMAGSHPIRDLRVMTGDKGRVSALVPRGELPREGAPLKIGAALSPYLVAAGPGRIRQGSIQLSLPEGAVGTLEMDAKAASFAGTAARLDVGPYALQNEASVEFPGYAPKAGVGVYDGGTFLDNWTGKMVPFYSDGLYALREDTSPPVWGRPVLVRLPHVDALELRLSLTDRGSGPNLYSLRLTMDGKAAFADWDPDTHTVRVDLSGLAPGRHVIAGTVADWEGNRSLLAPAAFTVKQKTAPSSSTYMKYACGAGASASLPQTPMASRRAFHRRSAPLKGIFHIASAPGLDPRKKGTSLKRGAKAPLALRDVPS